MDDLILDLRQVAVPHRLKPVTLRVTAGSLVHLIGPNGAGKSTLLAAIGGVMSSEGEISLLGRSLRQWHNSELALHRGYLCQQNVPYAVMPVFQYLTLHQPRNATERDIDRTVGYLAEALSLADKLARPLNRLSGGEWQRVRLAAVLLQVWPAINPRASLLLLDEPAASLDIAQRVALDALLAELIAAGMSIVVCAHDLNHSLRHAREIWLLSAGRLAAQGSPQDVMQPAVLSPVFGVEFELLSAGDTPWLVASGLAPAAVTAI
ncbi:vitamin B12 ABC transporter ATP-binding protein BtuD [Sodalis sp. dw_96]|uniref:vitamin B12 ABC transporter ATP-binding protein BtuD n=1 Tax=Sodalis sp. dw_96 TaxID=2719794 RepID=UPI001BD2335F|nr:vitamin B12 ABC transporter ATP-binding protein BtuD [Sodalis sp. dw_96]